MIFASFTGSSVPPGHLPLTGLFHVPHQLGLCVHPFDLGGCSGLPMTLGVHLVCLGYLVCALLVIQALSVMSNILCLSVLL